MIAHMELNLCELGGRPNKSIHIAALTINNKMKAATQFTQKQFHMGVYCILYNAWVLLLRRSTLFEQLCH